MPVFIITAHYYMDDMYEELGPTKFIAGSHKAGRRPTNGENHYQGMPAQSLLVKGGDCVMFRSDVWHRKGKDAFVSLCRLTMLLLRLTLLGHKRLRLPVVLINMVCVVLRWFAQHIRGHTASAAGALWSQELCCALSTVLGTH